MTLCSYCREARAIHNDHIMSSADRRRFPGWDSETVPACGPCNWRKLTRHLVPVGYPRLAELQALPMKGVWAEWDGSTKSEAYKRILL